MLPFSYRLCRTVTPSRELPAHNESLRSQSRTDRGNRTTHFNSVRNLAAHLFASAQSKTNQGDETCRHAQHRRFSPLPSPPHASEHPRRGPTARLPPTATPPSTWRYTIRILKTSGMPGGSTSGRATARACSRRIPATSRRKTRPVSPMAAKKAPPSMTAGTIAATTTRATFR